MTDVIQSFRDKKILLRCWMFFVLAMVVMVGTTAPFHAAYADAGCTGLCEFFLGGIIAFIVGHLASAIITAISMIFILINVILSVFEVVAGIVMSAVIHWIQVVPYTPINQAFITNSTNPITTGWTIMRDLADMGLIFVLIAIAIATILNISFGKNVGRTIISFVGVAILINFSPLITGVIIDITNILTNIFFQNAGDAWRIFAGNATLGTGSAGDLLGQVANDFKQSDITIPLSLLISSIVSIALTLTVIAAFVTMTFLLLARVLALWILVILSPLAFLMYILPSTKQHFEKWWHNFFQWAMLPIPLGLSYYLSAAMVQGLSGSGASGGVLCQGFNGNIAGSASGIGGSFSDLISHVSIFNNFCVPMVLVMAVAFMFVGFFISFSFSAAGSKMIVAQGTRAGAALGTAAAHGAGRLVGAGYGQAEGLGRKVGGSISGSGAASKIGGLPVLGGAAKGTTWAAGKGYKYTKMGVQKGLQYGLPLTKQGLQKMGAGVSGKAGEAMRATGGAMASGVFEPGLKADFTYIATGLSVQFTDTSRDTVGPGPGPVPPAGAKGMPGPGVIVSWSWSFGDGASSSQQNPTHAYAAAGSHNVTLTVKNSYGKTASANKNVSAGGASASGGGTTAPGGIPPLAQRAAQQRQAQPTPPFGGTAAPSPVAAKPIPTPQATPKAGIPAQAAPQGVQQTPAVQPFPANGTNQDIIFWLRQIALAQQGMGLAINSWTKKDKTEKAKIYEELSSDRDAFTSLAKRIPDVIQSSSPQVLQKIYNVATPQAATRAMHRSLAPQDFSSTHGNNVPEEYLSGHSRQIVQDVDDAARVAELDDAIRTNSQYSQRTKDGFTYQMFDSMIGNP